MTNSLIPYSFTPGTKAKASEVNANFISLANTLQEAITSTEGNISDIEDDIDEITGILNNKANIPEIISTANTNLNNYTTKGVYEFSSSYLPQDPPAIGAGILIVMGSSTSFIKQFWINSNQEIFARSYSSSTWSSWAPVTGELYMDSYNYYRLPSGLFIQWGRSEAQLRITYPVAFSELPVLIVSKHGFSSTATKVDAGFVHQTATEFEYKAGGTYNALNWIAFGK